MKLSAWVKSARKQAGLSQEKLGFELGVTKGNISAWENDLHNPSVAQVEQISRISGLSYPPPSAVSSNGSPELRATGELAGGPSDGNLSTLQIRQFNVSASMGAGSVVQDHIEVVQAVTVSLPELRKLASFSNPPNLAFITGYGDSMTPTFNDGDLLLVDQNITEQKIDAVFAFTYDGEFYVKTLQRVPGRGVMAVSHNRTVYEPFRIEPEKPLTIHGRVVLAWNARKL